MLKYLGKFIGPDKIVGIKPSKRKTYLGNIVAEIELENETKIERPVDMLDAITTDEKSDLTELRTNEAKPVAQKIIAILTEAELPISSPVRANIYYLLQDLVPESIQKNTRDAYGKLFEKDYYEVSLLDIDKALNGKKHNKTSK